MAINRRDFLRLGAAGAALGASTALWENPFFRRPLQAAMMGEDSSKKMLLIFLRGGCDGVNMVIPQGDTADYNDTTRPTLFIDPDDSHELTTYCHLHPSFNLTADNIPTEDLAAIHQVAYSPQSRSHFDSQAYWETAYPNYMSNTGWVNTLINQMDLDDALNPIPAATFGGQQLMFGGSPPLPHVNNLANYSLKAIGISEKLLGALPGEGGLGDNGAGMLGVYSRPADDRTYDEETRGHGLALSSSLAALADLDPNDYEPDGDATYPEAGAAEGFFGNELSFFRQLKQAVMVLKLTDCRVAGIQIGGFDTHTGQNAPFTRLMNVIDHALWAVYEDTKDTVWDDMVVATLSEFGRTSNENGSAGSDHGEGAPVILAGGAVNGGVYNCDQASWGDNNAMFAASGRYVRRATDFRAVLAELIDVHFGQEDLLDSVIPGWDGLSDNGSDFDYVGCIE